VTNFVLNNQPDALIIQIYSLIKLHVSGIFCAHYQELSPVHSALVRCMQVWWPLPSRVRMEQFHPDSARKRSSNLYEAYQCRMYSRSVFFNRRAAARCRALASIILGRKRFSWNLSFYFS